jgi:hypothetical protein
VIRVAILYTVTGLTLVAAILLMSDMLYAFAFSLGMRTIYAAWSATATTATTSSTGNAA